MEWQITAPNDGNNEAKILVSKLTESIKRLRVFIKIESFIAILKTYTFFLEKLKLISEESWLIS